MAGAEGTVARKQAYFTKLIKLLDEYPKIFIVGIDNVGSKHMQSVRQTLRGKAVVLMGKNTMIRKAIRGHIQNNPALETLLPHIKGNVGFVFAKDDLPEVKKLLLANKVAAAAKQGGIAPIDVIVPKGNTGLEPSQTNFFQALNIQTKINKGQIEITNDVPLIKAGQKVGASEANLLLKLDIKPFAYGLVIKTVYDNGAIYDPAVLDLSDDDIIAKFQKGVKNIASLGLAIGYPTVASLPHSVARGFQRVLAVSLATNYSFPQADKFKAALANPVPQQQQQQQTKPQDTKKKEEPKKEEPKKKVEEKPAEEEEDLGLGLFD
jgi:large subunit ribosomal protein LP0